MRQVNSPKSFSSSVALSLFAHGMVVVLALLLDLDFTEPSKDEFTTFEVKIAPEKKASEKSKQEKKSEDKEKAKEQQKESEQKKNDSKQADKEKKEPKKEESKPSKAKKAEPKKREQDKAPAKAAVTEKNEAQKNKSRKSLDKKEQSKKAEPKKSQKAQAKPKKTEPKKTEPKKTEPKKAEPLRAEKKLPEPQKTEPKKGKPKKAEPKKEESKRAIPKGTEAKFSAPKRSSSREKPAVGSNQSQRQSEAKLLTKKGGGTFTFGSAKILDDSNLERSMVVTKGLSPTQIRKQEKFKIVYSRLNKNDKSIFNDYVNAAAKEVTKNYQAPKCPEGKYSGVILFEIDIEGYIQVDDVFTRTPSGCDALDLAFYNALIETEKIEMPSNPAVAEAFQLNRLRLFYDETDL